MITYSNLVTSESKMLLLNHGAFTDWTEIGSLVEVIWFSSVLHGPTYLSRWQGFAYCCLLTPRVQEEGEASKLRAMDNHSGSPRIKGNISKTLAKSKMTQGYLEDSNHTHIMCYFQNEL